MIELRILWWKAPSTKTWPVRQVNPFCKSKERCCYFFHGPIFLLLEMFVWFIYIHNIHIHFYIFQGDFKVLKLQCFKLLCGLPLSEAYSEPSQTSKMQLFDENVLNTSLIATIVCYHTVPVTVRNHQFMFLIG